MPAGAVLFVRANLGMKVGCYLLLLLKDMQRAIAIELVEAVAV